MTILSKRLFTRIEKDYREACGLSIRLVTTQGQIVLPETVPPIECLPTINHARGHALSESLRWGEPQAFFIAPGIMSWIVALVDESDLQGGIVSGCVVSEKDATSLHPSVNHLVAHGAARADALAYVNRLPLFAQERIRETAEYLKDIFYQYSGWHPYLLERNADQMLQQRQIAEAIHQHKAAHDQLYSFQDERILLSHIRVGDRAGARRIFNNMLAAMFLHSPKLVVIRARAIEMIGYLVRAAVEDSPFMEPLLDRHMLWIEQIVETKDFDNLCLVLRDTLDDFMNSIFLQGVVPASPAVRKALDFIDENYATQITLDDIATAVGLSTFRIAHLLKEATGKTPLQNIHYRRIEKARALLETTDKSCTDIAYECGFGDQSYFIKRFKMWMGITPAKYRKTSQSELN